MRREFESITKPAPEADAKLVFQVQAALTTSSSDNRVGQTDCVSRAMRNINQFLSTAPLRERQATRQFPVLFKVSHGRISDAVPQVNCIFT